MNSKPLPSVDSAEVAELVRSREFFRQWRHEIGRQIFYQALQHQPIEVEHEVSEDKLALIIEHVQGVWTKLGAEEPHWSVLSTADFKPDKIEENRDRFEASGKFEVENTIRSLARCGLKIDPEGVAIDYGCGVGRISRWLAPQAKMVYAVDISPNHLKLCKDYVEREGVANVRGLQISSIADIENIPRFDFLFSKIVLQHNPPPVIAKILGILCRRLRPNGIGIVQIPTYWVHYKFQASEYLSNIEKDKKMEMHVLPQPVVFDILDRNNCVVREVIRDHMVGNVDWVSSTFIFQKRI